MKKWILSAATVLTTVLAIALFVGLVDRSDNPQPTVPSSIQAQTEPSAAPAESTAAPVTVPPTTVPPTTVPPTTVPPTEAATQPPTEAPTQPTLAESSSGSENDPGPYITASEAFVYDWGSGELLYQEGGMDDTIYPASITKLFTAYVALQYLSEDTVVTCGEELWYVDPDSSLAEICYGNRLTVDMLVEGMLLPSGNDAAYALAAAAGRVIAGDPELHPESAVDVFVEEMNFQAAANGMSGTHFSAPDGIHWDDHYTTMRDLITVAKLALSEPSILNYSQRSYDEVYYESGEYAYWVNTNKIINPDSYYYHPNCVGLKTGHTSYAGYCLLSAFWIDGRYVIVGVFGCPEYDSRFDDTLTLIDYYT